MVKPGEGNDLQLSTFTKPVSFNSSLLKYVLNLVLKSTCNTQRNTSAYSAPFHSKCSSLTEIYFCGCEILPPWSLIPNLCVLQTGYWSSTSVTQTPSGCKAMSNCAWKRSHLSGWLCEMVEHRCVTASAAILLHAYETITYLWINSEREGSAWFNNSSVFFLSLALRIDLSSTLSPLWPASWCNNLYNFDLIRSELIETPFVISKNVPAAHDQY